MPFLHHLIVSCPKCLRRVVVAATGNRVFQTECDVAGCPINNNPDNKVGGLWGTLISFELPSEISQEGRIARFAEWEKRGVEAIKADLLTGSSRYVGGPPAIHDLALEWVRNREANDQKLSQRQPPELIDKRSVDEQVKHAIILVHGIRTYAPWQNTLRAELEAQGTKVELTNYGYFDLLRFWLPIRRIRSSAINRVWISIRDVRALYPYAKISFLAHSFGTYIVASILRREFDFRAHKIVFCGSVVRYDFPFHEIADRFTSPIINEVGSKDYLPALAESVTWGYGSAGTYGFRSPRIRDRWHNASHSEFLTEAFCKRFWVPFFADGTIVEADREFKAPPFYIRFLSKFKVRNVIIILIFLISFITAALTTYFAQSPSARAVMYNQTAQSEGKVFWTSPLETIEAGKPQENIIEAEARIPTIGTFHLSFFPNMRRGAPRADALYRLLRCRAGERDFCAYYPASIAASHFLVLRIEFAESFRHGIASIPEVFLKQTRAVTGFLLNLNSNIRPSDDDWASMQSSGRYTIVYALSDNVDHERVNLWNIQELPLIEIDIPFADGSRGYVVIEKGTYGQRIVRETLQKWGPRY